MNSITLCINTLHFHRLAVAHEAIPKNYLLFSSLSRVKVCGEGSMFMPRFLLSLIVLCSVFAVQAQNNEENVVISPQSIVVNPLPSFEVEVFVDKDSSGDAVPVYDIGERIRISVKVTEDAYVYLFNIHSDGEITQILPNNIDNAGRNNFIQAGQTKNFPPMDARYSFDIAGPNGLDKVIAVASKQQLATDTLQGFTNDGTFLSSSQDESSFAQTLSIVVTPLPQESWVTDTALFNVGQAVQARYGTLAISSNPAGASAYVDGVFVGRTPTNYGTTVGTHSVSIGLDGYNTFETSVNVPANQVTNVTTNLGVRQVNGRLNLRTNVAGALIFINNVRQGELPAGGEININNLPAGIHTIRLEANGFATMEQQFEIRAGETSTVNFALTRSNGMVNFTSSVPGAEVYIGNEYQGTTPTTMLNLPAGRYDALFRLNGYNDRVVSFDVQADSSQTVTAQLERDSNLLVPAIGLQVPSGVTVNGFQQDDFTTILQISSNSSPEDLYTLLHNQILNLGYQRQYITLYDPDRTIEAEYLRSDGSTLFVELISQSSTQYQLTVSM